MKTALESGEFFFQVLSDQTLSHREWLFDLEPPLIALRILARKLLIKELAPFSFKNPSKKEELEKLNLLSASAGGLRQNLKD